MAAGPCVTARAGRFPRPALLIALVLVAIAFGLYFEQDKLRGAGSPSDVAERYVAAARAGDTLRVRWLMPSGLEELAGISAHIDRLRSVNSPDVSIVYVPNQIAGYIVAARISVRGVLTDEIVLQAFGDRWYLVHFTQNLE